MTDIITPERFPQLGDIAAGNKAKFDKDVDYFINWMVTNLVPGMQDFVDQLNNFVVSGSSASNLTIGLGNKTLVAEQDKGFIPGMTLRLAATENPSVWMQGDLISYVPATGAFGIAINKTQGEGTYSSWQISLAVSTESSGMGQPVASAANPNIWLQDGNKRAITGTTGITGFAAAPYAGAHQWIRFADALTITAGESVILGVESYTTQAGDWAIVLAETTTRFRVMVIRRDGKAINTAVGAGDLSDNVVDRRHITNSVSPKVKDFAGLGVDWTYVQMVAVLEDDSALVWGRTAYLGIGVNNTADTVVAPQKPVFNIPFPANHHVVKWMKTGSAIYAVISNGWVYSAGDNSYGMLGHGDTVNRAQMCRIEYFVANNIQITDMYAASSRSTLAAGGAFFKNAAGQVWVCGYNYRGELGVGDGSNRSAPTPIPVVTGVKKVVLPTNSGPSYLLLDNGTVLGAGYNGRGQLGVGDLVNKTSFVSPASLSGLNIVDLVATHGWVDSNFTDSGGHVMALTVSGDVYTTGNNGSGQLGLGDTTNRNTFTKIPTLTNIVKIGAAGGLYGYCWAVSASGQLYTWGRNNVGQLGNGGTTAVLEPWRVNQYQRWSGTALETVSSDPPFVGKIAQIEGEPGFGLGYGGIVVLDTDGGCYVTGYDNYTLSGTNTANKTRFTVTPLPLMDVPGEKITKIFRCGYDQYDTLFGLTNQGNLYSSGYNGYTVASAVYNASTSIPGFQKVML